jgi:hypothetical protein
MRSKLYTGVIITLVLIISGATSRLLYSYEFDTRVYYFPASYEFWMNNNSAHLKFTKIDSTKLENGTWVQELHIENGGLYSVSSIKDREPKLYKHDLDVVSRKFVKNLCTVPEKPSGFDYLRFHKGFAITRVEDTTYAFVNMHNGSNTLTALYTGDSVENLEFYDLVCFAGYFEDTKVNFRIREVWFNNTDNKFYCYYDGSSVWKGTHLHTYLGISEDVYFTEDEFTYLYSATLGSWSNGGMYGPHVLWLSDDFAIGCVKGHRAITKPYDFDCDLVWMNKPSDIHFYSYRDSITAFFEEKISEETQLSMFIEYKDSIYLFTRNGEPPYTDVFGEIYEVDITID